MISKINRIYYRWRFKRRLRTIHKGYSELHHLMKRSGYPRSDRRRIIRNIIKDDRFADKFFNGLGS